MIDERVRGCSPGQQDQVAGSEVNQRVQDSGFGRLEAGCTKNMKDRWAEEGGVKGVRRH